MQFYHYILAILLGFVSFFTYHKFPKEERLEFGPKWFGTGDRRKDNEQIKPFKVDVPKDVLDDLRRRLSSSRVSHSHLEDSDNFWYGMNEKYLKEIKDYWLNKFDWKKQEAKINSFKQFKTEIEGLNIHFIHEKPSKPYKRVVPLLIVHGWPGNVFEFYQVLPLLTDPKAHGIDSELAFEVIAPSIPGYGWSDQPKKTGFSQIEAARVFKILMNRLSFDKFYVQGGDWGSLVVSNLARLYPQSVLAMHLNMIAIAPGSSLKATFIDIMATYFPKLLLSSKTLHNHNFFERSLTLIKETGYMHIQATKPDTVGTALNDSPIGLAAYILEKFSTWTNQEFRNLPDGGLERKFTKDELLTMVMIYWVNGNIVSSQRFYREFFLDTRHQQLGKKYVSIPTAHASGLNELYDRTPREMTETLYNITHYTEMPNTGHFACFEEPEAMAKDILHFVSTVA